MRTSSCGLNRGRPRSTKKRESGARRVPYLSNERAQQNRRMSEEMTAAALYPEGRARSVATVTLLSSYYSFAPLLWDDLSPEEKFGYYQIAGDRAGCNVAFSFVIPDMYRREWVANENLGSITGGFRDVVVRSIGDGFRNRRLGSKPSLWFVVEPKKARGKAALQYADGSVPRRFDIHGAARLTTLEELDAFESALRGFVEPGMAYSKYAIKLRPIGGYHSDPVVDELWWRWFLEEQDKPVCKRKRIFRYDPIYQPAGWMSYVRKSLSLTAKIHADVCGSKPYGATQDLKRLAKALYNEVRAEVLEGRPYLPASARVDLDIAVAHAMETVPATAVAKRAEAVKEAVRCAMLTSGAPEASSTPFQASRAAVATLPAENPT